MQLKCDAGHARVDVSQQRFRPLGSSDTQDRTWKVPVCVTYGIAGERRSECNSLSERTGNFTLAASGCPTWFLGNSTEVGYYYTKYEPSALHSLITNRAQLSLSEQVGLYNDFYNMLQAGRMQPSETLRLAEELRDEPQRQIVDAALRLARVDFQFLPEDVRPKYVGYVERTFGFRARKLGWVPKDGDSEDDRFIRTQLVPFVARAGEDGELIAGAKQLTDSWLNTRTTLPADMIANIFSIAARNGDAKLYEKLLAAVKKEKDEFFQSALFTGLAAFRQRELVEKNLQLLFGNEFDWRVAAPLLFGPQRNPEVAQLPLQFVKANYDSIVTKLPSAAGSDYAAFLPRTAEVGCSSEAAEDAQAFFGPRMTKVNGGPRALAQAAETIKLCEARKSTQEPDLVQFFR